MVLRHKFSNMAILYIDVEVTTCQSFKINRSNMQSRKIILFITQPAQPCSVYSVLNKNRNVEPFQIINNEILRYITLSIGIWLKNS